MAGSFCRAQKAGLFKYIYLCKIFLFIKSTWVCKQLIKLCIFLLMGLCLCVKISVLLSVNGVSLYKEHSV